MSRPSTWTWSTYFIEPFNCINCCYVFVVKMCELFSLTVIKTTTAHYRILVKIWSFYKDKVWVSNIINTSLIRMWRKTFYVVNTLCNHFDDELWYICIILKSRKSLFIIWFFLICFNISMILNYFKGHNTHFHIIISWKNIEVSVWFCIFLSF